MQLIRLCRMQKSRQERIANEVLMYFRSGRKTSQDISMNEPIESDKDGNSLTLSDVLASEDNICENLEAKTRAEHLRQFLASSLTDREREVVELRYGLRNCLPLTQREVAARLDISRSYVSRIEKKALSVLRREFEREQRGC